jgi:hypothetical protein
MPQAEGFHIRSSHRVLEGRSFHEPKAVRNDRVHFISLSVEVYKKAKKRRQQMCRCLAQPQFRWAVLLGTVFMTAKNVL